MAKCLMVASEIEQLEMERELRRQICKTGRKMYAHGFVVACEGNLSVRLDRDRILVTPAGACKGHLGPEDLLVTDLSGVVLCGTRCPLQAPAGVTRIRSRSSRTDRLPSHA